MGIGGGHLLLSRPDTSHVIVSLKKTKQPLGVGGGGRGVKEAHKTTPKPWNRLQGSESARKKVEKRRKNYSDTFLWGLDEFCEKMKTSEDTNSSDVSSQGSCRCLKTAQEEAPRGSSTPLQSTPLRKQVSGSISHF